MRAEIGIPGVENRQLVTHRAKPVKITVPNAFCSAFFLREIFAAETPWDRECLSDHFASFHHGSLLKTTRQRYLVTEPPKKTFLERNDRWGHGMSLWVVAAVAFVLPLMAYSLKDIRLENDVVGWLPQNDPQAKVLAWYEELFPSKDRILVSWDGASITDARFNRLQEILEGVRPEGAGPEGGSAYVSEVTTPSEVLSRMLKRRIPIDTALDHLDGVLIGLGPLKIQLTDAGRSRGEYMQKEILRVANDELQLDAFFTEGLLAPPSAEGFTDDDSDARRVYDQLSEWVRDQPLHDLQLEWPGMGRDAATRDRLIAALMKLEAAGSGSTTAGKPCIAEIFQVPGSIAAVAVSLSEAGIADKKEAVAAVRRAVADAGVDADVIRLGGQPVVSVALNSAVVEAAWNPIHPLVNLPRRSPIILSVLVTVALSFVMLGSLRLATLVQVVSFFTVTAAVAIIPLSGGAMNMVLVVMPTLLGVLTTSAAIHLANYWKHSGIENSRESVFAAARTAWLPCVLASGTTAIGLASLVVSNLVPVKDFGLYSALGCGISFFVVLYVLPSLMLYWPASPPNQEKLETGHWRKLGVWLARHRLAVSSACLIATATAGWGLWQFKTETKVIRYFPQDSRLVQDYVFLEEKLSGVISIDTIVKFDETAQQKLSFVERGRKVMELQQEIREHQEISGVLSLASFLDLRLPNAEMSMGERFRLNRANQKMTQEIRQRLTGEKEDADGLAAMIAVAENPADWKVDGDRRLNRAGDEIWRITAQTSALSEVDLGILIDDMNTIAGRHLREVQSPFTGHTVTGLVPVFLRTQQAVLESLIRSFGAAFLIIAIVMMGLLRSPLAGLFTMIPNLMPVVLVFGLLSWSNLKVDIGTMITASVALGIAVDGTLHLLTWFKQLVKEGHEVEEAVGLALEHCGPAMWQTSLAIGVGMLALLPAELLLVSRFGWMMAALIFAAMVADVIFLPALLGGHLGRLIKAAMDNDPSEEQTSEKQESVPLSTKAATSLEDVGALRDVS